MNNLARSDAGEGFDRLHATIDNSDGKKEGGNSQRTLQKKRSIESCSLRCIRLIHGRAVRGGIRRGWVERGGHLISVNCLLA